MWSLIIIMSPTLKLEFRPPAAFVTIKVSTPRREKTRTGYVTFKARNISDQIDNMFKTRQYVMIKKICSLPILSKKDQSMSIIFVYFSPPLFQWQGTH